MFSRVDVNTVQLHRIQTPYRKWSETFHVFHEVFYKEQITQLKWVRFVRKKYITYNIYIYIISVPVAANYGATDHRRM